jgi:hypothetical protein
MSEPILERLSRFTPDAGSLDRDALLFAAGRSSARPNRGWMALASLLAGTQVMSLVLLFPHATPPAGRLSGPVATASVPPATLEPPASGGLSNPSLLTVRYRMLESEPEDRPTGDVTLIDSGPPLRAFATPAPSLVN